MVYLATRRAGHIARKTRHNKGLHDIRVMETQYSQITPESPVTNLHPLIPNKKPRKAGFFITVMSPYDFFAASSTLALSPLPNGSGRGVSFVDGGKIGNLMSGCLPVRVFKNATMSAVSASENFLPN